MTAFDQKKRPVSICAGPLLLALIALVATSVPSSGVQQLGKAQLSHCEVGGIDGEFRCGTVTVAESPNDPTGRRIALNVIVALATVSDTTSDPLFVLLGGPGVGTATSITQEIEHWGNIRRHREIVFIDPRGTGRSNPLSCGKPPDRLNARLAPLLARDRVVTCRRQLEGVANLTSYTTSHAADDLERVRAALGYERINIYALSYGTRVAQEYLRRHDNRVRAVVLHGVVPAAVPFWREYPDRVDAQLTRVLSECKADTECRAAFPDLERMLAELLAKLREQPIEVDVENPETGERETVLIEARHVSTLIEMLLFSRDDAAEIPLLVDLMWEGRYELVARAVVRVHTMLRDALSWGLYLSVMCTERVPFAREPRGQIKTRLLVDETPLLFEACASWVTGEIPDDFHEPVESSVPVLVLSGANDPTTPPQAGEAILPTLPTARHVVLRNTSHLIGDETWEACVGPMVERFIESANSREIDAVCAEKIKRADFVRITPMIRVLLILKSHWRGVLAAGTIALILIVTIVLWRRRRRLRLRSQEESA